MKNDASGVVGVAGFEASRVVELAAGSTLEIQPGGAGRPDYAVTSADQTRHPMRRLNTSLEGPILVEPVVHGDERGFFSETYRRRVYESLGIVDEFVQDNHSRSKQGIVRGMHFQVGRGMAKLVHCARGSILDVVVDLRKGSPTFGGWEAYQLSDENMHQLYCPIGFAHGFCVMSEFADVIYKCSAYYDESIERGIKYDDPDVGITWPEGLELQPSERDQTAPLLREVEHELPFRYKREG